jgi:hypothetical protein
VVWSHWAKSVDRSRGAPDSDRAEEAVGVDQSRAENLGQPALGDAREQLHLPEPVLRVRVSLRKQQVVPGAGPHVRHAHRVAHHLDRARQTRDGDRAVHRRARAPDVHDSGRGDGGKDQHERHGAPREPSHVR